MPDLTPEQALIVRHPADRHGRVLAGPGTGKSSTVLALARGLMAEGHRVKVITFTRAATAELAEKVQEEPEGLFVEPVTMHSFALSVLVSNPDLIRLPLPLRIPDEWEQRHLIHDYLARRLRARGFEGVSVKTVDRLERELSARFESLDPKKILLSKVDPDLRSAYLAEWQTHRKVFGYSLFAEMPNEAGRVLADHPDAVAPGLDLLIVDEYQDLNKSDIRFVHALVARGCHLFAVGDDDQSIYGFRMADPSGIRNFPSEVPNPMLYELSVSHRCGTKILDKALDLIASAPGRPEKKRVTPAPGNPPGVIEYLRFSSDTAERVGVVTLVRHMLDQGLPRSSLAILVRADSNRRWSRPIQEALDKAHILYTDVESALVPLHDDEARKVLAVARLALHRRDSLSWWSYLKLTNGVSRDYLEGLIAMASAANRTFAAILEEQGRDAPQGLSTRSHRVAAAEIARLRGVLDRLDVLGAAESGRGWADWVAEAAAEVGIRVSAALRASLDAVGEVTPQDEGLEHFLNQLEPVTQDLALKTDAVSIMTMSRSKGLTFRGVVVMGVEAGIIPHPMSEDQDEERRLLYVAMTRPKEYLYLSMATERRDATAHTGVGPAPASGGRCIFLDYVGPEPIDGAEYVQHLVGV